jgi:hypothetical protein
MYRRERGGGQNSRQIQPPPHTHIYKQMDRRLDKVNDKEREERHQQIEQENSQRGDLYLTEKGL